MSTTHASKMCVGHHAVRAARQHLYALLICQHPLCILQVPTCSNSDTLMCTVSTHTVSVHTVSVLSVSTHTVSVLTVQLLYHKRYSTYGMPHMFA